MIRSISSSRSKCHHLLLQQGQKCLINNTNKSYFHHLQQQYSTHQKTFANYHSHHGVVSIISTTGSHYSSGISPNRINHCIEAKMPYIYQQQQQQHRPYGTRIRRRTNPNPPSPYLKSIKFMAYFFSITGFFFFILTRLDEIEEKVTPIAGVALRESLVPSERRELMRERRQIEKCLQEEQFGVLPCLNRIRLAQMLTKKHHEEEEKSGTAASTTSNVDQEAVATPASHYDPSFLSDVLLEMADRCDSMMELSKADELYNEAAETGDARALVAYGTYKYEKSRELKQSADMLLDALKELDPEGYEEVSSTTYRSEVKSTLSKSEKKALAEQVKRSPLQFDYSQVESEEDRFRNRLAGAAWNNLGMITRSKAADQPQNLDLSIMVRKCFQRAAYFGDSRGAYNTGMLFMTGRSGITKMASNYPLAKKYFEQSESIHARLALAKLAESGLYDGKARIGEAYEHYKEARQMGYGNTRFLKQMLKLTYVWVMGNISGSSKSKE